MLSTAPIALQLCSAIADETPPSIMDTFKSSTFDGLALKKEISNNGRSSGCNHGQNDLFCPSCDAAIKTLQNAIDELYLAKEQIL